MSDECDSEEGESAEDESTDAGNREQADSDWQNEEIALEKYNKCLLLSDSYPGQCQEETYEPKNCGGKKSERLEI
ncbi:unnamed protein product, partial [Didymodactylos carnosus]